MAAVRTVALHSRHIDSFPTHWEKRLQAVLSPQAPSSRTTSIPVFLRSLSTTGPWYKQPMSSHRGHFQTRSSHQELQVPQISSGGSTNKSLPWVQMPNHGSRSTPQYKGGMQPAVRQSLISIRPPRISFMSVAMLFTSIAASTTWALQAIGKRSPTF